MYLRVLDMQLLIGQLNVIMYLHNLSLIIVDIYIYIYIGDFKKKPDVELSRAVAQSSQRTEFKQIGDPLELLDSTFAVTTWRVYPSIAHTPLRLYKHIGSAFRRIRFNNNDQFKAEEFFSCLRSVTNHQRYSRHSIDRVHWISHACPQRQAIRLARSSSAADIMCHPPPPTQLATATQSISFLPPCLRRTFNGAAAVCCVLILLSLI